MGIQWYQFLLEPPPNNSKFTQNKKLVKVGPGWSNRCHERVTVDGFDWSFWSLSHTGSQILVVLTLLTNFGWSDDLE